MSGVGIVIAIGLLSLLVIAELAGRRWTVARAKRHAEDRMMFGGDELNIISLETAEVVAHQRDTLWLPGLTTLTPDVARALAKCKDILCLNGLTTLSPD